MIKEHGTLCSACKFCPQLVLKQDTKWHRQMHLNSMPVATASPKKTSPKSSREDAKPTSSPSTSSKKKLPKSAYLTSLAFSIKADAIATKAAKSSKADVSKCPYCEAVLRESMILHIEQCTVRQFYKHCIYRSSRSKWRRFYAAPDSVDATGFRGFDEEDLRDLSNPYDYYLAKNGLQAYEELKGQRLEFILGPEYCSSPTKLVPLRWKDLAELSDRELFTVSVDQGSSDLGEYSHKQNLAGFSCPYRCSGFMVASFKEIEPHLRKVHSIVPRFNCNLCTGFRVDTYHQLNTHIFQTHGVVCEDHNIRYTR